MADDMNAQDTSQTTRVRKRRTQLTKATDMTFDLSSFFAGPKDVNYMMENPSSDLSDLPALSSLPTSSIPSFCLAPSITQAMQQTGSAMLNLPYAPWSIVEPDDPNDHTLSSDNILEKSFRTDQAVEPSPDNVFTSESHRQAPRNNPSYAETPPLMTQESSDGLKKQAAMEQQKEKEADTRVVGDDVVHVGFSDKGFMFMKNLLALNKLELINMNHELELTQESNTKLRTRLFDATEELARAKEKLSQKDSYISACDKKIGALQRKLVLLTQPYNPHAIGQTSIDSKKGMLGRRLKASPDGLGSQMTRHHLHHGNNRLPQVDRRNKCNLSRLLVRLTITHLG